MNQLYLEALFNFADSNEKIENFKTTEVDESTHFYYNDNRVGGFAGDKREFFIDDNSDANFLVSTFNFHQAQQNKNEEKQKENNVKIINLDIRTKIHDFNGSNITEVTKITNNKSLGYIDGPEDPIYDLYPSHNPKELLEQLRDLKDNAMNFPRNPVFKIEGEVFAELNHNSDLNMSSDFSKELLEKYEGKEIVRIKLTENDEGKFEATYKLHGGDAAYIRSNPHGREPKQFDNKEDALESINRKLGNSKEAYINDEPFISPMQIILKPTALNEHAKSIPAHAGYTSEAMSWRDSIRQVQQHFGTNPINVETKYLFDNSFTIKHPNGSSISIDANMVDKVINDKRELTVKQKRQQLKQ
jgi:hypothetical protein